MQTRIMKWVSLVLLIGTTASWSYAYNFELPVRFAVCLGAFLVARQAVHANRRYWAAVFCIVGLVFNPFLPIIRFSGEVALFLVLASALAFAFSLLALKTKPLLSMPSITDRVPGSESL